MKGRCHTGVCIQSSLPHLFLHLAFSACTCTRMSSCHCHSCRCSPLARFCVPIFPFLGTRTGISHISADFLNKAELKLQRERKEAPVHPDWPLIVKFSTKNLEQGLADSHSHLPWEQKGVEQVVGIDPTDCWGGCSEDFSYSLGLWDHGKWSSAGWKMSESCSDLHGVSDFPFPGCRMNMQIY